MKYQVLLSALKQGLILKMPSAAFLVWTFTLESVHNRKWVFRSCLAVWYDLSPVENQIYLELDFKCFFLC